MPDSDWVTATATRNFASSDPLLDWLNLYGEDNGFVRDQDYDDYDSRTDFSLFIMHKGIEFETAVAKHISTLTSVHTVIKEGERRSSSEVFARTQKAMESGESVIYQAALWHEPSRTYGTADFLIRSDKLQELFPGSISSGESRVSAPGLGENSWHYRVIDAKFTTLHFLSKGDISSSGSSWAYMLQVYIYNRALGAMQGYTPPGGYLLGRKWEQTIKGETLRSNDCMNRLAFVPSDYYSEGKGFLSDAVERASEWIRRVRTKGDRWNLEPAPSIPELRPNMGSTSDQPWHHAKSEINQHLKDLTTLWQVGVDKRNSANLLEVYSWDDKDYSAEDVGVKGVKTGPVLQSIIDINRNVDSPAVLPLKITQSDQSWREEKALEFYVDFETVSDLCDDFTNIPISGGQPLIFMIGCGHLEQGDWKWSCFTTDALTELCEAEIIDEWIDHMAEVQNRLNPNGESSKVFHWSHAEQSTFETAFNSAKQRHPNRGWLTPDWYDFLKKVMRQEPVVVKGSFGFGLKSLANSMRRHGAVQTEWDAGPADGLGAMVGAWWAASEAGDKEISMQEVQLIRDISRYNEVDCKVMMELISYLRNHH